VTALRTITVALGERSYPIHIGTGLLAESGVLLGTLPSPRAVVVTNPAVAEYHLEALRNALSTAAIHSDVILVPDGEQHKDWSTLNEIHTRLLELGADRSTTLIAFGGGVVGDVAGFAAATYQRGIPLVQVPTTLLAQVDSSVGGKTAINHPLGKNMIGAFYQPRVVISDTATLATLPAREYVAGIAEVIKYGAIRDPGLFEWLEANMDWLRARATEAVAHAVSESCRIKAGIVAADERESGCARLNFGHTFGHAIEAATGYGTWLHGEAVAAGWCWRRALSERVTGLPAVQAQRIRALIGRAGLERRPPPIEVDRWLDLMSRDKKTADRKMRFVLLSALGAAVVRGDVAERDLHAVLQKLKLVTKTRRPKAPRFFSKRLAAAAELSEIMYDLGAGSIAAGDPRPSTPTIPITVPVG
jgi:3-dehydroquinate synthase